MASFVNASTKRLAGDKAASTNNTVTTSPATTSFIRATGGTGSSDSASTAKLASKSFISNPGALAEVPTAAAATPAAETPAESATPAATMRTPTTTGSYSTGSTGMSSTTTKSTPLTYTPQTYTPTGMYDPANLQAYNAQREAQIRQMYADAQQSTLAGLKTAYDQNLSDATAYRDQISPQYQRSMSALGAEYERQRRNNNMQAAANGLNTGAGSQMALAQSANYQANQAGLAAKENQALDEANRRLTDLKANYQNAIAEATAQNNYKLAASLLDEYQNAYNRQLNIENTNYQRQQQLDNLNYERQWQVDNTNYTRQFNENEREYSRATDEAAKKAQYGDFSGYASLYGDDVANMMQLTWAMQNPQIAYAAGKLSAEDYAALTGQSPSGSATATTASASSVANSGSPRNYQYVARRRGGGYSASRDRAYRGAAGYYDIYGNFVSPGNFAAGTALGSEGAGTPVSDSNPYQGTPSDAGRFQSVSLSGGSSGGGSSGSGSSDGSSGGSISPAVSGFVESNKESGKGILDF